MMAAELSAARLVDAEQLARIERIHLQARLPVRGPDLGADRYLELMAHDKKVEDGKLRLVLLKAVGEAVIHGGAGRGDILAAIEARQGD